MGLMIIAAPEEEPVSLAAAKLHLRVDHDDEDALIRGCIAAARQDAEHQLGRALCAQTLRLSLDRFPGACIELLRPPLLAVKAITYLDGDGVRQTLDPADYRAITDELVGYVLPAYGASWPTVRAEPGAVQITYTAGWPEASDVPESIKSWIKVRLGTLYKLRATVDSAAINDAPRQAFDALLDPYRVYR